MIPPHPTRTLAGLPLLLMIACGPRGVPAGILQPPPPPPEPVEQPVEISTSTTASAPGATSGATEGEEKLATVYDFEDDDPAADTDDGLDGGARDLGLSGVGRGGGGVGEGGIGLGGIGTIGRGSGPGGYGAGVGSKRSEGGTVVPGTPMIQGSLDREVIRRVLAQHRASVRYCYDRALVEQPALAGKIVVKLAIDRGGHVANVALVESTVGDEGVEACVVSKHRHIRFPEPTGGTVMVTIPLVFVPGEAAPEVSTTLKRFPNIEGPTRAAPGKEIAVLVSLTEISMETGTRVTIAHPDLATPSRGEDGELDGGLSLDLGDADFFELGVVLSAPDFLPLGPVQQTIFLPRDGDSTPAVFRLQAPEGVGPLDTTLHALFSHEGRFVARVARDVHIGDDAAAGAVPIAAKPAATVAPEPFALEHPEPPDLVIVVHGGATGTRQLTYFLGGSHQPSAGRQQLPDDFRAVLQRHYRAFQDASSRSLTPVDAPAKVQSARDLAVGLGRDLHQRQEWAPEGFDEVFWKLTDALGDDFDTIEVVTDDPVWPWELMRPSRFLPGGGYEEQGFLGTRFRITRWHLSSSTRQRGELDLDPRLEVDRVTAVAPDYARPLAGQETELAALRPLPGYRRMPGTHADVRTLFESPAPGIVHFAGHGVVGTEPEGSPTFSILLNDGEQFAAREVRGLGLPGARRGVFYFFNACEVGAAGASGGFVEGWPAAVLDGGADGFIGALWPVGDLSAAAFAESFYGRLHASDTVLVAEALRASRAEFDERGDPTWLAYVMYGDPSLQVVWR